MNITLTPRRESIRLSLVVTMHTLVGGDDNPDCFSLAATPAQATTADVIAGRDVRVVNMRLGAFNRVAAQGLLNGGVLADVLEGRIAILTDPRIPKHELTPHLCGVCMPFAWLTEADQRERLRLEEPMIRDGKLTSWGMTLPFKACDDATVDARMAALREIGAIAPSAGGVL